MGPIGPARSVEPLQNLDELSELVELLSCGVGACQSSFSRRTRPSALTSTTTASIGSTYNLTGMADRPMPCRLDAGSGRGALRVGHADHDRRGRRTLRAASVRV